GAYGLYPVGSKNVLIDGCVAIAASDAGIYVGQSEAIIIRNSIAMDNVAGFEVENSYYADVYDNTAVNNTGGFLVFDLPNLPQQGGHSIRVFNNVSVNNNTPNFAPEGNIVATVPQGLGIMVMANRNVEIFNNVVDGNQSVGLLINTYPQEYDDPEYNPHPRAIHVHDNRFGDNGYDPKDELAAQAGRFIEGPLADIVWDGVLPAVYPRGNVPAEDWIYIHNNDGADFIDLDFDSLAVADVTGMPPVVQPTRSLKPHRGSLPPVTPVRLEFDEKSD
ncbi:MAG: parallel beta-helix domain-containing protein, partial [Alphaproteobacteria bacterium]|nr:parallel beta-helix domain-containing protein [Alphaproteobacteria bacterium]